MRISWLELQMTIVLAVSVGIFAVVAIFIVYVCFVGGRSTHSINGEKTGDRLLRTHKRVGSKAIIEAMPIVFTGHKSPVEYLRYGGGNLLVSTSIRFVYLCSFNFYSFISNNYQLTLLFSGEILVFDVRNGDFIRRLGHTPKNHRQHPTDEGIRHRGTQPSHNVQPVAKVSDDLTDLSFTKESEYGRVWSVAMQSCVVAVGYSTGRIELWDGNTGLQRASYVSDVADGITHLVLKGSRIVAAHLKGFLEFLELRNAQPSG